jgi:hypothetical protein
MQIQPDGGRKGYVVSPGGEMFFRPCGLQAELDPGGEWPKPCGRAPDPRAVTWLSRWVAILRLELTLSQAAIEHAPSHLEGNRLPRA